MARALPRGRRVGRSPYGPGFGRGDAVVLRRRTRRTPGSSRAATPTSSRIASWRSSSTAFAATRLRSEGSSDRQSVRVRCGRHRLAAVQASLPEGTRPASPPRPGEATEIARGVDEAEAIYVLGGDGTYNEVLNGVRVDVPLGFLPGGGQRSPAGARTPTEPRQSCAASLRGHDPADRARACQRPPLRLQRGLGFDAELVRKVDRIGRTPEGRRPGDIAFVRVAASVLGRGTRASTSSWRWRERDARRSCSLRTALRTPSRAPEHWTSFRVRTSTQASRTSRP